MELEGNRDTFIGVEVTRTVLGKGPDFFNPWCTAASTVEKCERFFLRLDWIMAESFLSAEGNYGC